jgi:hypothetical protein
MHGKRTIPTPKSHRKIIRFSIPFDKIEIEMFFPSLGTITKELDLPSYAEY